MPPRLSIHSIFKGEDLDSRLSRFVIDGALTPAFADGFSFTEMGNWLIDKFPPYRDKYAGSHIQKNYKLHTHRTFIQKQLDALTSMKILSASDSRQGLKNTNLVLPIYKLTQSGQFLAWLLRSESEYKQVSNDAAQHLLEILFDYLGRRGTAMSIFYRSLLEKIDEENMMQVYIELLRDGLNSGIYPLSDVLRLVDLILHPDLIMTFNMSPMHQKAFLDAFNDLDEEIQQLVEFEFKLHAEQADFHQRSVALNWEKARKDSAHLSSRVTLLGTCDECGGPVIVYMATMDFASIGYFFRHPKCPKRDCPACGTSAAVKIIPLWTDSRTNLIATHILDEDNVQEVIKELTVLNDSRTARTPTN